MLLMFEQKLKSMRKGITEEAKNSLVGVYVFRRG